MIIVFFTWTILIYFYLKKNFEVYKSFWLILSYQICLLVAFLAAKPIFLKLAAFTAYQQFSNLQFGQFFVLGLLSAPGYVFDNTAHVGLTLAIAFVPFYFICKNNISKLALILFLPSISIFALSGLRDIFLGFLVYLFALCTGRNKKVLMALTLFLIFTVRPEAAAILSIVYIISIYRRFDAFTQYFLSPVVVLSVIAGLILLAKSSSGVASFSNSSEFLDYLNWFAESRYFRALDAGSIVCDGKLYSMNFLDIVFTQFVALLLTPLDVCNLSRFAKFDFGQLLVFIDSITIVLLYSYLFVKNRHSYSIKAALLFFIFQLPFAHNMGNIFRVKLTITYLLLADLTLLAQRKMRRLV